jgi:hypothetical protein
MPDRPDWTYGTILVSHRARITTRIVFLGWDEERRRMLGGGQPWFRAMKLYQTKFSFTTNADEVGEVANYTPYGWKRESSGATFVVGAKRGGKMAAMRSVVVGENGPERLVR